jgi:hypothetical protein
MGDQTEQILEEKGEGSCVDYTGWRINQFTLSVNTEETGVEDPRLFDFCQFLQRLVPELNQPDSEMVVYPTMESTVAFLETLEAQVIDKYNLVFMWCCEVEILDFEQQKVAMEIQLYRYDHAEIFGYNLQ